MIRIGVLRALGVLVAFAVLTGMLCGVLPSLAWADKPGTSQQLVLSQTDQDWLAAHPVVRIGIDTSYAPYSILDKQGQLQGIAPEFLAYLGPALGVRFEVIADLDWPQLMAAVQDRRIDVVATVAHLPEREAFLEFTAIYLPTPLVIMTRDNTPQLRSIEDLDKMSLVLVHGYSSSKQVVERYPALRPHYVAAPLEGLMAVASGATDAYIGVLGVSTYLAAQYGFANLKVNAAFDMQMNGQRFGVRKDWPQLARILDRALVAMPAQRKNEIFQAWMPSHADDIQHLSQPTLIDHLFPWLAGGLGLAVLGYLVILLWNRQLRLELARRRVELERAQRIAHLGDWSMDPAGNRIQWSDELFRMAGRSPCELDWPTLRSWIHPEERDVHEHYLSQLAILAEGESLPPFVSHLLQPDGSSRWLEIICTAEFDRLGKPRRYCGTALDITERKAAEIRITQLNRLYRVLSRINEAIVRLRAPQPLFDEACRIAVEVGGFRMAWLGMVAADSHHIRPVAHAGVVDHYLENIHISLDDDEHARGPTGTALREGQHVVCNDIANDPNMVPWRDAAQALGYRASAAFPIRVGGQVRGAFNLYADHAGFFDDDELRLLDELAEDIGFALEFIEADLARATLNRHMVDLLESMSDGFVSLDRAWCYQYVNRKAGELFGRSPADLIGKHIWTEFPEGAGQPFQAAYEQVMQGGEMVRLEDYYPPWDQWYENRIYPTHDGISIFFTDITERKQTEVELRRQKDLLVHTGRLAQVGGWEIDVATMQYTLTDELARIFDLVPDPQIVEASLIACLRESDRHRWEQAQQVAIESGQPYELELELTTAKGARKWIHVVGLPVLEGGQVVRLEGAVQDITEFKLAEQLRETRIAVLDGLMGNQALSLILGEIAGRLEAVHPDMRVSILVSDPRSGQLFIAAAPSLPDFFNAAVNGLEPGVGHGSCGTSAATGEPCIVEDISSHEFWVPYAEIAERAGLRACWSIPFKDQAGKVLGAFSTYYAQPRTPTREELNLIGEFARIAGLAVERGRAELSLRQAAAMFESTREGVVITDLQPRIVDINPAYTAITGYTEAEVLGCNPSLLQSGREDKAFYQAMWGSIIETGHWQGEIWNRRKNGELFPELLTISTVYDAEGLPSNYVGVMTDISQLKDSEARLAHLAHYDPLTHLPNRLLLQSRLKHALETAERHKRRVAVLYIDLDRFKNVNDSLGHPVGDELLEALALRMRARLREDDTLGRLGGDEFLLILEDVQRPDNAAEIAQEMIQMLEQSFHLPSGHEVYVGASIGISLFPDDGLTGTALIQHADVALYQAKETGRNTFSFYTPGLTEAADERLDMEARLRRALVQDEFVLHYQPQVDMHSGVVTGCEALVRWNDPERGLVSPARFIPLAEETGLIVPLGEWVLHQACVQARAWLDAGLPPLQLSVNLSARQLQQANIVERVAAILEKTGLPAGHFKLELTESMIMGHGEEAVVLLQALKDLGLSLSIDDFGTGYSSLAYLKRFPIDELKIDQGFVRDIPLDHNDMEIAAAIISLARSMRLKVVAEGVETEAQREFLLQQGCNAYQGFLFSEALPADDFSRLAHSRAK